MPIWSHHSIKDLQINFDINRQTADLLELLFRRACASSTTKVFTRSPSFAAGLFFGPIKEWIQEIKNMKYGEVEKSGPYIGYSEDAPLNKNKLTQSKGDEKKGEMHDYREGYFDKIMENK